MGRQGDPPRRDFQGPRLSHLKGSPPSPRTREGEAGRARTPRQQAPEGGPTQCVPCKEPPPVPSVGATPQPTCQQELVVTAH